MSAETEHSYEFGNFVLDPREKILFCDNKPVALTPKVFETLQIFVEHAGRLLEKDELMKEIWHDRFVEESNLTFNIKMLRRVLNDDAHQPRFIETVPRRGYRFIAEVKPHFDNSAAQVQIAQSAPLSILPTAMRWYFSIAALAVLVVGPVAIAWWFAQRRHATSASSVPILSMPFKSAKFASTENPHAVITPDGKYVAYTSETGGKHSVWLRQLETSENIQVVPPTDEQYLGLAISHDGNSLYFVRKNLTDQPTTAIYRVMTFGGIPVKITDKTQGWISVSPDDKQLSFVRCKYQDDDFCSLFVTDADGKNERTLLTRKRPIRISDNQFSLDGKSIAFAAGQSWNGGSDFHLMRLELSSGAVSEISQKSFFDIRNLKWLPDGDGLLLTANQSLDSRLRIWHVSAASGEARALTSDAIDYTGLSLNSAADKMIATQLTKAFHLYVAKIDDLNNPKNLATARSGFAFAPDGKIVYEGNDGDIWTINRDGGEQRQLTNNPYWDILPRVSSDGRYVFFTSNRSGSHQVWRMNADGSNQIQITKREGGYVKFVTPDGNWVYFESGPLQTLWRVSSEGGEETQISAPGRAFSPDGKFVAYFLRDKESDHRFKLALMSLADRRVVRISSLANDRSRPLEIAWASDSKSFYYITAKGSRNSLWRQSLDEENPHLVGDLGDEEIPHFAVSPDGTSFAFIRGRWIHDAVLIEGLK